MNRALFRAALLLGFVLAVIMTAGACTHVGPAYDACEPECDEREHNAGGGYRDACGELPGMLGDDC